MTLCPSCHPTAEAYVRERIDHNVIRRLADQFRRD
jgi:hypothetical protein